MKSSDKQWAGAKLHERKAQNKALLTEYCFVFSFVSTSPSLSIFIYEMGIIVPNGPVMKKEWEYICIYILSLDFLSLSIYIYEQQYLVNAK